MSIVLDASVVGYPRRRIILRNGQVATFGSDLWTDFSFPADSGLALQHFRLDCRNDRCELIVLDQQSEVFQNEMPVRSAQLRSGDRLTIGTTTLRVHFGGLESRWSEGQPAAEKPRFTVTTAEACQGVAFAPAVAAIVKSHPDPPECLEALATGGSVSAAIRVLAAVLPARAAIWWMCDILMQSSDITALELKTIEEWIVEPTESRRRQIESGVQNADRQSPVTWLGWAVFWSGPSLAPAGVDAIQPPAHLVGTAIATSAMLFAARHPLEMASTLQRILLHGRAVLDGQRPWPALPS